eukprot:2546104-Pleurochrysis_carterae.AAC.4
MSEHAHVRRLRLHDRAASLRCTRRFASLHAPLLVLRLHVDALARAEASPPFSRGVSSIQPR